MVNLAASIRQRLLNLARARKEDFGLVLTKYGLERVLYRISQSKYRESFVLKGALLFELWTKQRYRPTRDADFLARGESNPERFVEVFQQICEMHVEDDGLRFDANTVTVERITEDADYEGVRVKFVGYLEKARIPIQIDLGFGDVITPGAVEAEIPSMLDLPRAKLQTYPRETVVAEKFEAMVNLGLANSRMKDFYDLLSLSREFPFEGKMLSEAIQNTFARRGTQLPVGTPVAFTPEFFEDADKKKQWAAFCNKNRVFVAEISLESVCREIAAFLMLVVEALNHGVPLSKKWSHGSWRP
jgi:predicted nucleotidyltransferase component of viral defense system